MDATPVCPSKLASQNPKSSIQKRLYRESSAGDYDDSNNETDDTDLDNADFD